MTRAPDQYFMACRKGNTEIVSASLNAGVDPNARDEYQLTGLIWAARKGQLQVAKLLIAQGGDVEAADVGGRTPLFHAAAFKKYEFVEFLATSGANVNPVDSHGWTPLDFSRMSSHKKMAQLLESLGGVGRYTESRGTREQPDSAHVPEKAAEAAGSDQMDDEYKFQLVLQLPGATQQEFDALVSLEESLADALDGTPHEVDGHDFGSGTGNIFIDTNDPIVAFELAKKVGSLSEYPALKAAYRSFAEDDYHLIWPENSTQEFELM